MICIFGQKSSFCRKNEILRKLEVIDKHRNFWGKNEILAKNRNFGQKSKFWTKNDNLFKKLQSYLTTANSCGIRQTILSWPILHKYFFKSTIVSEFLLEQLFVCVFCFVFLCVFYFDLNSPCLIILNFAGSSRKICS